MQLACLILLICVCLGAELTAVAFATEAAPPTSRRETVLPDYVVAAKNVGRIVLLVPADGGGGGTDSKEVCSGVAISADKVVTARHCFYELAGGQTQYTTALFVPGPMSEEQYTLKHEFLNENADEDFVVLQTQSPIKDYSPTAFGRMKNGEALTKGESLFMLHFPGPGSMVLTRMDCVLSDPPVVGSFLHHNCDTTPGSSGAPIFNNNFRLVGMHLQGGRGNNPTSFNTGVTFTAMVNGSEQLAKASKSWGEGGSAQPTSPVEYEYKTSFNVYILKRAGAWSYRVGKDGAVSQFIEQANENGYFEFWRPVTDQQFKLPVAGGRVDMRPSPAADWVELGTAERIK